MNVCRLISVDFVVVAGQFNALIVPGLKLALGCCKGWFVA